MNQVLQLFPNAEPEPASEPVQESPGKSYAQLWRRYLEVLKRYAHAVNDIRSDEQNRFGGESWSQAIPGVDDFDTRTLARKAGEHIRNRLVWIAQDHFAPVGARLSIDMAAIQETFPLDPYAEFDPARVWDWLETTYGGEKGEMVAWRQAVAEIIHGFDLERMPKLETKSGYVVLNMRVWMEGWRSQGKTLSHHSHEKVTKALMALSGFARWDGRDLLSRELYRYVARVNVMDAVVSRAKTGFGVKGLEVILVTFHTVFEVRLRPDVAERLQVFLATHRQEAVA